MLILICASVLLSSIAQIVLKGGMSSSGVAGASGAGFGWPMVHAIATNPLVLLGLGVYFASAVVWLLVLARVDVSLAYPFVGLGFVLTMLFAWAIHGEVPTAGRIAGTLMICAGIVVLARA
jgi:multidrug transporter EmrE-like cation transporter